MTYDPCDPPFYQTFCFGYYFTLSWCLLSILVIKTGLVSKRRVYTIFLGLGVLNDLVFVYNFFHYYVACTKCDTYQLFIDLVPNIQAHFWTSDFILMNFFMFFLIGFAATRFDIPNTEALLLVLLSVITTPAVGGMYAYIRIEEYYETRKSNPNKISPLLMWLFIFMFSVIILVDIYYLVFYSRMGPAVYPADYNPNTNFQLLLYYEAFMTPAVLLEAMTIFICYASYPLIIITNLPPSWNILIKLVISVLSILLSFAYVAGIVALTIIGFEMFANYFPSYIGITKLHEHEE